MPKKLLFLNSIHFKFLTSSSIKLNELSVGWLIITSSKPSLLTILSLYVLLVALLFSFISSIFENKGVLNLNEDLIEAIALGHDIGHTPLGHAGEAMLNRISLRELNEYFAHNVQSVRNLMYIENNGNDKNVHSFCRRNG